MQGVNADAALRTQLTDAAIAAGAFDKTQTALFKGYVTSDAIMRVGPQYMNEGANSRMIIGTDGSDGTISVAAYDTVLLGKGDETIAGTQGGNATVIYRLGDGNDSYTKGQYSGDAIMLGAGITRAGIEAKLETDGTSIRLNIGDGSFTLIGAMASPYQHNIIFNDGTRFDLTEIHNQFKQGTASDDVLGGYFANDAISGLSGTDVIYGNGGNDQLDGGEGDDRIYGGVGDDTLQGGPGDDVNDVGSGMANVVNYATGDGRDTLLIDTSYYGQQSFSTIHLTDAARATLTFTATNSGKDMTIGMPDGGSMTVRQGIEYEKGQKFDLLFADGTRMTFGQMLAQAYSGTSGNDIIHMTSVGIIPPVSSGAGNDRVIGGSRDDVVDGGTGDDVIDGNDGRDRLRGGLGNDILRGGQDDDTYVWRTGDGNDRISNEQATPYYGGTSLRGSDTLLFEDAARGQVTFQKAANDVDLLVRIGAETILIENGYSDGLRITNFTFSDGSTLNGASLLASMMIGGDGQDVIKGNAGANVLRGGLGDDVLIGRLGNDRYVYARGDGNDVIDDLSNGAYGETGGSNTVEFTGGILRRDVRFITSQKSELDLEVLVDGRLAMTIIGGTGTIRQPGFIDNFQFSDGTIVTGQQASREAQTGSEMNDVLWGAIETSSYLYYGSPKRDMLNGFGGDDLLMGGGGSDVLRGGTGNDRLDGGGTNHYENPDQLYGEDGDDVLLADDLDLMDGGNGIDMLDFTKYVAGNVTMDVSVANQVYRHLVNGSMQTKGISQMEGARFGSGDDTFVGNGSGNVVEGNAGNDRIKGGGGNDRLSGGDGDDTLEGEGGRDNISGGEGNDVIRAATGGGTASGGGGDDLIVVHGAGNVIEGGAGYDVVDYRNIGLMLNSSGGTVTQHGIVTADVLSGVEKIIGSELDDLFDYVVGLDLSGAAGNDGAEGGGGLDFDGGEGIDRIFYRSTSGDAGHDLISVRDLQGVFEITTTRGTDHVVNVEILDFQGTTYALTPGMDLIF